LHFYRESEEHYKDITETKEIVGGMKGVTNSNGSASPSPFSFAKEFVEQQCRANVILKFVNVYPLQTLLLARRPKES
jgi:hypothetical protein